MTAAEILDLTRKQFPEFADQSLQLTPLEKGGSDRTFSRIDSDKCSMIFIHYSDSKSENLQYVTLDHFLASCGLRVPEIFHHDAEFRLIWMQNLGELDLWFFRNEPWSVRKPYYLSAIEQTVDLQLRATPAIAKLNPPLQPAFDSTLYRWEQDYFFDHCLIGALGLPNTQITELRNQRCFGEIIERLAALPRSLVHRDFQSQNLMLHDDRVWLIDFQGMRMGRPEYDLASLLYDPYVELREPERREILAAYGELIQKRGGKIPTDFDEIFDLCALQRLMQALGAYGFLGLQKDKPHFLNHIPAAKKSLTEVATRIAGLEPFVALLNLP